jgi:hypothetical protein
VKKYFLTLLALLSLANVLALSDFDFDDEQTTVTLPKITLSKVDAYAGKNLSIYLVTGTVFAKMQVKKLIKKVATVRLEANPTLTIPPQVVTLPVEETPNYVVFVVHESPEHFLNKYPISYMVSFDEPEYADVNERSKDQTNQAKEFIYRTNALLDGNDISTTLGSK